VGFGDQKDSIFCVLRHTSTSYMRRLSRFVVYVNYFTNLSSTASNKNVVPVFVPDLQAFGIPALFLIPPVLIDI
jgi:hypothetical protein